MKTKNKIEETIEVSEEGSEEVVKAEEVAKELKISPFTESFNRQDINLLRDKVNEVIDFLNK